MKKSKNFLFDFDAFVSNDEELLGLVNKAQNLRFGAKHVLLLSPDKGDAAIPLNWDRPMTEVPGALPGNQVMAFCWHKTEGKWQINYPNFDGHSLSYLMFGAKQDGKESNVVLRQYCDPPRVNRTDHESFLVAGWSKLLLCLSGEDGGISKEHR